jgi:site-specific recombinase XerD
MVIRVDPSSEATVQAFADYQRVQQGLAERTVYNSTFVVRQFLAWRARTGAGDLEHLRPEESGDFVLHEARRLKPRGMPFVASTVRSFVRFLFVAGITDSDLSGAVPSVKTSRFGALPTAVEPEVLRVLLDSCKRSRAVGLRDRAILLLMSRLGLRASEIARMRLDDVDWRAGELEVRGKGARRDRLPLPHDVGSAIASYLRSGRPPSLSRAVFLQVRGAPVGMSRNAVVLVSRTASRRAGITVVGGHRLRHSAASQLLRSGSTIREVGQVLRQDDSTATAIYAKVDRVALSSVARPWSEGRPR